jgi:hexosaminidase
MEIEHDVLSCQKMIRSTGMLRRLIVLGLFPLLAACASDSRGGRDLSEPAVGITPRPLRVETREGFFEISPATRILCDESPGEIESVARYFADFLRRPTGFDLGVMSAGDGTPDANAIVLSLDGDESVLGPEGYTLLVEPEKITLSAAAPAGLFYGIQTIRQLLPPEIESPGPGENPPAWQVPCASVTDKPRFGWRGMMLDVSRHFFPKEFIYRWIDHLARYKLNTFHWHLTDDQGWRVEIKKYPGLTEIGAWRVDREDRHWNERESQREGEEATYGGFYTQEEIRDIVAYARSRFITIIPEIEMPGHTSAALAAYPQFSCTGGPFTVLPGGYWPITDIFCAGNEGTFRFLQDILTEVIDLFPGTYIHVGGDEADKTNWRTCPKCQARIRQEGLEDEDELQSWFIRRIEKFLNAKGRRLVGWDEILEGGLAPRATVMSWRGMEGGIAAARERHDVVMSPTSHCYFDYYQGDQDFEPLAIGGDLPLRKVYAFEPVPEELTAEEALHILGGQANLWAEYVADPDHAEYMIFPRMAALAEAVWSAREKRDWDDFAARVRSELVRLEAGDVQFAHSVYQVRLSPEFLPERKALAVGMTAEMPGVDIRYTLDGDPPSAGSRIYRAPLSLVKSSRLMAASFSGDRMMSPIKELAFEVHRASGTAPLLGRPYGGRYTAGGPLGLTDGLFGSVNHRDGRWQGFEGDDLEALIDLGRVRSLTRISVRFLERQGAWIFPPVSVEYAVSRDGEAFEVVLAKSGEQVGPREGASIIPVEAVFPETKARFVRVRAKNLGACPDWHRGTGRKAWLFADEIVVK